MICAPNRSVAALARRTRTATLLVALLAALSLQVVAAPVAGAATPQMYQDQAFAAGTSPTEDKPQSKLWFNDGFWWALMRTNTNGADGNPDITIHKLQSNHTWLNTGTVVDGRAASTGDALWEDGKLYVASRVTNGAIQAARLSYNASTDAYTMDAGLPKSITSGSIESVTIARDSLKRLWVTFTKPHPSDSTLDQVWVAHSTTSDATWTAPFLVPVSDNTIKADDISAIVAFGGKVGVMWSDQQSQVMRFAVHGDSSADNTGWTMETALSGTRSADDHLNLKSLLEDDQGRVYAAIKTSRGDVSTDAPSDPSIRVLSRSSTGTWTPTTAATVSEGLTRPQLALDSTNKQLYVVMSTESGGNVYYRKAGLGSSLSFGSRVTLLNWTGARINNATTAKAAVTAATGLVVLASDEQNTRRYYHAELALDGSTTPPATDTTAPTVSTVSPASGATGTAVSANVTATFSEAMDAATITGANVTLTAGGTAVPAAVSYDAGTRVATLNPTSDLAASTSYTATVTTGVKDVAGNALASARTWTFTTAAAGGGTGQTVTLTATEDSYVASGSPGTNFGAAAVLVADGSPVETSYLKFDLAPYAGRTVTGATLQVRSAGSGSTGTQNIKLVTVDTWTESTITYSNRPALGTALGKVGPTSVNTNYTITLTASGLQGELGQVLSLGIDSTSTDGLDLNSSETATPPKLVLTLAP
jgi:hypothetical protein